jgi:hypothetical protein
MVHGIHRHAGHRQTNGLRDRGQLVGCREQLGAPHPCHIDRHREVRQRVPYKHEAGSRGASNELDELGDVIRGEVAVGAVEHNDRGRTGCGDQVDESVERAGGRSEKSIPQVDLRRGCRGRGHPEDAAARGFEAVGPGRHECGAPAPGNS